MIQRRKTPRPKALWVQARGPEEPRARKPIRRRSKKMTKRMQLYRELAAAHLLVNPECAVFRNKPASEIHHSRGRAGTLLIDRRFFVSVSREGHNWIHQHPKQAVAMKLTCPPGQWNKPIDDEIAYQLADMML